MKGTTCNRIDRTDATSDQQVALAIDYLDTEYGRRQRQFPPIFAAFVALIVWGILIWILVWSHL